MSSIPEKKGKDTTVQEIGTVDLAHGAFSV